MLIEIPTFKGEVPIVSAKYLPVEHAQEVTNADLSQNTLKPFYELDTYKTLDTSAWRSIFPVKSGGATFWVCTTQESHFLNVPIEDAGGRFYYSDGVKPKESNYTLASDSEADTYGTPNTTYYLGVPKPKGTFAAAPKEVDGVEDEGDILGSISYCYTFVTEWGYESEPSDPTPVIDIHEWQYVELSNFEIPVPSDYNIVGIRIYRTVVSSSGEADFQLVSKIIKGGTSDDYITDDEITANDGVWDDMDTSDDVITDDADLAEVIATTDYIQPPDDIKGFIALPNGVTAGYKGREVYLSEPYIHYGFPLDYVCTTDFDIKSIGWYGTTVVVGTDGNPYKVNGYDPQNVSIERQPDPQACLFSRAMVSGPRFVIYPSPDGLYMISDEGNRNITESVFTKEQWRDLLTDRIYYDKKIIAFLYDEKYYAFFEGTNDGFIIDFNSSSQFYNTFSIDDDLEVYGGHVDLVDDTLYLLVKDGTTYYIKKWEGFNNLEVTRFLKTEDGYEDRFIITEDGSRLLTTGTDDITEDYLIYSWKSKIFVTSHAFFSCMKIDGDFVDDEYLAGIMTTSGTAVTGVGTTFTEEIFPGAVLYHTVLKEYREVASIESDTALTLVSAFTSDVFDVTYYANEDGDYYANEDGDTYAISIPVKFKYNTTMLNIYRDDSLFYTRSVNSTNPFRLPSGTGRNWEIEIKGIGTVNNIRMAQSMGELK